MPAEYPTGAELVTFFSANGYPTITEAECDGLIASAIAEFESLCQQEPFLAAEDTKPFEAVTAASMDGFRLILEPHKLMANVAITHRDLNDVETELTEGTHFDMLPMSAGVHLNPYFIVRFRTNLGPGFVDITGQFGVATSVPQDVWDAIIDYAVQLKLSRMSKLSAFTHSGQDVSKLKQGPVELTYEKSSTSVLQLAKEELGSVAERYRF